MAHADVRSAPGRSSGEDVDARCRLGPATLSDMYAKRVQVVAGVRTKPRVNRMKA